MVWDFESFSFFSLDLLALKALPNVYTQAVS
jgi:hypothetical protein